MKKFLSVTLSLLLAASMPLSALAETYDLAQGSITVEAKADGNQYVSQTGGVQQEQQTTETIINQTGSDTASTNNTITIQAEKNQTAQVTISDVNIDVSSEGKAAISTGGDGSVTIELDGDNTAKSGSRHAGVEKNNGGNLTVTDADGDGALEAVGGGYGAGIGGGGAGQCDSGKTGLRFNQAMIELRGSAAGGANAGDIREAAQKVGNIIGDRIANGAVGGADDGAGRQNVPKRQPVGVQQGSALFSGLGVALAVDGGDDPPEPVLRVGVIEALGAAAGAGHGAKNESFAFCGDKRGKLVQNGLR